jgi:hypothetical protein
MNNIRAFMVGVYTRMKLNFRKIIVLMMVAVILVFSVDVAHEVKEETSHVSQKISIGILHSESTTHCPVCPINHNGTNHDLDNYDHHNYTPLAYQYSPLLPVSFISVLTTFERNRAFPEVYQDIFIPPQISLT